MKDTNDIEYDALNFDGLERRANYRTIAYREDILHAFERRDAAAIIYQIIYRWQTEYKRDEILAEVNRRKASRLAPLSPEEVEERMWVYMSYNDFVRESGQALGYNTVIRMLHYLVHDMKVVEQRENHDPHYPDYEYRINKDTVKTLLKALPPEPAFHPKIPKKRDDSTQMGRPSQASTQKGIPDNQSTQMGRGSTQKGIPSTHLGTEVYPNGGTSHITTHNYSHTNNREESTNEQQEVPSPIASALSLDAALSQSKNETHSQQQATDEAFCNAETEHRLPALTKPAPLPDGMPPGNVAVTRPGAVPSSVPGELALPGSSSPPDAFVHVLIVAQQFTSSEQWNEAQDAFIETLHGVWKHAGTDFKQRYGNWHGYRKQELARWLAANPEPTEESLLSAEARRIWQDWQTNYKRPIPLTQSDKQALTMLLPSQPTREELKMCRGWLFSTDDPNKPWYRKIGVSLLDCAKNWGKWQSLQEPPERGGNTMTRTPTREELRRMPV